MTSLQDKIAALKAGDFDVVLEGTQYDNAHAYLNHFSGKEVLTAGMYHALTDAKANAAKVIVLEEQVRVLRESLVTARKHLMEPEFGTPYSAMCGGAVGTMDAALAATDMGD